MNWLSFDEAVRPLIAATAGLPVESVPEACWYEEVSNSDSTYYGGSDLGNAGGIQALPMESHGRPASMEVSIPPLAAVIFKPRR